MSVAARRGRVLLLLIQLAALTGCQARQTPAPLPEGWKRVTVEHEFTIDVPYSMVMEEPPLGIDAGQSDPAGFGRMSEGERRVGWEWWRKQASYFPEQTLRKARNHPIWWTERRGAAAVNDRALAPFTKADSVIETNVLVADHRRVVRAWLLEPIPSDTVTTRRILDSIRFLSDGE